jgi:hypothetical protein
MTQDRPALRLVPGVLDAPEEWAWFCGHCAAPPPGGAPPAPVARVCRSCGLGLLLETHLDAVPTSHDAFVVVDARLQVQAMSKRAEHLLTMAEDHAVHRPVSELLVPADAEAGTSGFAAAVAEAVTGAGDSTSVFVRPWNTFGVRLRVRIAPCGPPRAALLVLESGPQRPLKAVRPH